MQRREWLKQVSAAGLALVAGGWRDSAARAADLSAAFPKLANAALERARSLGASFADLHVMQSDSESLFVREEMVQGVRADSTLGCSVRVLVNGAWGFAASTDLSVAGVVRLAESAVAIARAQAGWRGQPVEIETLPAHSARWEQPVDVDPFTVPLEEKVERLLAISGAARVAGADFCTVELQQVRERKWLANSFGSRIEQTRIRVAPTFTATVTDPKTGRFGRKGERK